MQIKPTVGRDRSQRMCKVHSDSCVNLMVIGEDGVPRSETSVKLIMEAEEVAGWMPYQLGQAAKTEAVQKAAERGFCS